MIDNRVYRDVYNFHSERLRALAAGEADFWSVTMEKMCALAEKHNNDEFVLNLLTAVHVDLEIRSDPADRIQATRGLARVALEWAMEAERRAS